MWRCGRWLLPVCQPLIQVQSRHSPPSPSLACSEPMSLLFHQVFLRQPQDYLLFLSIAHLILFPTQVLDTTPLLSHRTYPARGRHLPDWKNCLHAQGLSGHEDTYHQPMLWVGRRDKQWEMCPWQWEDQLVGVAVLIRRTRPGATRVSIFFSLNLWIAPYRFSEKDNVRFDEALTTFTVGNCLLLNVDLDPNVIIWSKTVDTPLCGKTSVCFDYFVTWNTSTTLESINILSETLKK